jgi:adenine-specific DNA-methyltransferase
MDGLATAELRPNLHYTIINPETGKEYNPNPANGWRFQRSTVDTLIAEKRIIWPKNDDSKPRFKRYLNEINSRFTGFSSFLDVDFTLIGTKELRGLMGMETLKFPKPVSLIKALIAQTTSEDDLILDFFSGSATTAHAVMQLNAEDGGNRRFIMVQLPEMTDEKSEAYKAGYRTICEIGKERIRRAGVKIKEEAGLTAPNLDVGFKVFKLDSSNLKIWDDSPITGENALTVLEARIRGMIDVIKPDRSELDIVYEIMLKLGQRLTQPVIPVKLASGRTVYGVGTGGFDEHTNKAEVKFFVCLVYGITVEDAEEMAEYAPGRIVFADSCFDNTEQKSNVQLSLKDKGIAIKAL